VALGELVMSKGGAGEMARRRWSAEEKAGIVLESLAAGVSVAELCRSH
jgi:transposase-like protein